ncbi:unnamed protein product [Schistosoma margrebowiei]|uniref:Uncharacterized protein n=1 Tax=Schistosoma margrebowiei TaxID=48269 RepID=A0A183NCS1_9TREM|nr:unnamed protein product [Schistosoma margrebowiei]
MESSRPKEERKTKEHNTPRNGNRHEKDDLELNGTRKEGRGQSGLENVGRLTMLHWEHEKDEQELDGIRKGGPGQSGLENAGRWPILHWE